MKYFKATELLVTIFWSYSVSWSSSKQQIWELLLSHRCIVLGDFNVNMMRPSRTKDLYQDTIQSMAYAVVNDIVIPGLFLGLFWIMYWRIYVVHLCTWRLTSLFRQITSPCWHFVSRYTDWAKYEDQLALVRNDNPSDTKIWLVFLLMRDRC